jgi:hypothetical protein
MNKFLLITILTFCSLLVYSQQDLLFFKKGNKTIALYKRSSYIIFQLKNREWYTGYIEKVQNDSFYVNPFSLHYSWMGSDTVRYGGMMVALKDVYAMLKKGVQVGYSTGSTQITRQGGTVKWYWIRSGWIFRVGAIGYTVLNVGNGLIQHDFSFKGSHLGIAAAVFVFGEILHHIYQPVLRMGKRFHLESTHLK